MSRTPMSIISGLKWDTACLQEHSLQHLAKQREILWHDEGAKCELVLCTPVPPVTVVQPLKQTQSPNLQTLNVCPFAHSRVWIGCRHSLRISVYYYFREPSHTHTPPHRLGDRVHAPSHSQPHLFFIETSKCVKFAVGERELTCTYVLVMVLYECTAFLCSNYCK